jgi:hypothetical protein
LRHKRHDSINPTIVEAGRDFEDLDACAALRPVGCVFRAAQMAVSGWFSGNPQSAVESLPWNCHPAAANMERRLMGLS